MAKIPLTKLKPNTGQVKGVPKNPRKISDDNLTKLKKSLKEDPEFTELHPILVYDTGENYVVMGGNMRFRAVFDLGWKEIECSVMPKETTPEVIKARIIKHNSDYGDDDWDALEEWDKDLLNDWGLDVPEPKEEIYTKKIETPVYESTGEKPETNQLYDDNKANELINEIDISNVTDDEKQFLRLAAQRHIVFDYENIAEYYAHADKKMQELMESSALVIIDYDKAIENGFVQLSKEINDIQEQDYDE